MAGKQITGEDLSKAIGMYCVATGKIASQDEGGKYRIMADGPQDGDPVLWIDAGAFKCSDMDFGMNFVEYLKPSAMPVNGKSSGDKAIMPTNGQKSSLANITGSTLTLEKVRDFFCKTATEEECRFALEVCAIRGLNPFKRDCYFVKYGGADPKLDIIVSKDFFMKKAMSHPDFEYFKAGVTVQKGEEISNVGRYYAYPGETLIGGWAEAKRKSIEVPFRAEIPLSGFVKESRFWKAQPGPGHMIRKCAGSIVLREAYPEEFGGLYDADEMNLDPSKEVVV